MMGALALLMLIQQNWVFLPEPAPPHHIHVVRDGIDLGRAALGTYYDGSGSVFVADSVFVSGFEK